MALLNSRPKIETQAAKIKRLLETVDEIFEFIPMTNRDRMVLQLTKRFYKKFDDTVQSDIEELIDDIAPLKIG